MQQCVLLFADGRVVQHTEMLGNIQAYLDLLTNMHGVGLHMVRNQRTLLLLLQVTRHHELRGALWCGCCWQGCSVLVA
jgi:hypothetical protein